MPKSLLDVLAGKLGFVAREQTQQARIAEWAARVRELSLRQRQVMGLVAQGLSNKDIELSRRREIAQLSYRILHTTFAAPVHFAARGDSVVYRSQQTKALALARHIAVAVVIPGLIAAGAVLGPGGPGPSLVRGEPTASPVSHARFRDEERSTVEAAPNPTQSITVSSAPPARSEQTPAFTALTGLPTAEEAMRATRIAQEKIKVERAKRQLARERARAIAARRLDPFHGQPTRSVYSYAPHRTYGPFNNGWNPREILLKKSEADR